MTETCQKYDFGNVATRKLLVEVLKACGHAYAAKSDVSTFTYKVKRKYLYTPASTRWSNVGKRFLTRVETMESIMT